MKLLLSVCLAIAPLFAIAGSHDLALSVQVEPQVLKVGDRVVFKIRYINTSNRDLAIIPEGHVYEGADVDFRKVASEKRGIMIPNLILEYNFAGLRAALRVLQPGRVYERQIRATVSSRLYKSKGSRTGLYLLFSDSAVKLPGFGIYNVSAEYAVTDYLKQFCSPKERPQLWVGKIAAPPTLVEFRSQ